MRYKVGDRVRVQSLDWHNQNKNKLGNVPLGQFSFNFCNTHLCGAILTIKKVLHGYYLVEENSAYWTDEMIEGLVEEENNDCEKCGLTRNSTGCLFMDNCLYNKQKNIIEIPKDWVLKDENGNVINATKIVLEKKKKEYPKTYEECCKVLDITPIRRIGDIGYKRTLLNVFEKLLICRDAYWKIAGEEMGLGKPWELDYDYSSPPKYMISCYFGDIIKEKYCGQYNRLLSFPTEEMRDAFYENFKELIEECKELL